LQPSVHLSHLPLKIFDNRWHERIFINQAYQIAVV